MKRPSRIVIADDSADLRFVVRQILELEGFEIVGEASDGEQAVSLVATHQPDAILLDLKMPNMDGREAIPRIREAWPDTKIVMLSGLIEQQNPEEQLGLDAVVVKGTRLELIVDTLKEVLGRNEA